MVNPARTLIPCTPRKSVSTCSRRIAATATGPTSASEGVRTPPVSTTVRSARGLRWKTSATGIELVITVSSGTPIRCWASAHVVVPAESATAVPGRTSRAARRAISLLLRLLAGGLGGEPGLLGGAGAERGRAAVHLLQQPPLGEHLEVAADGHVGDAELAYEVGHPDAAGAADAFENRLLPLLCEHAPAPSNRFHQIMTRICWGMLGHRMGLCSTGPGETLRTANRTQGLGGKPMARRARKGKARRKRKANHGKRPTAR